MITDTRDLTGRITQASTTGITTATQVNYSTDGSDNSTWVDTTTGSGPGTTVPSRYSESISGDLGARILAGGSASIPLSTPHGDVVTTVPVGTTLTRTTPSTSCSGWVDYTGYGLPDNPTTGSTVGGDRGYGWLGAKHRSTTTVFSAGLTLMGDRLYDPVRGSFTTLDPTPGGNTTAYTYSQDPINTYDLTGDYASPEPLAGGGGRVVAGMGLAAAFMAWLRQVRVTIPAPAYGVPPTCFKLCYMGAYRPFSAAYPHHLYSLAGKIISGCIRFAEHKKNARLSTKRKTPGG